MFIKKIPSVLFMSENVSVSFAVVSIINQSVGLTSLQCIPHTFHSGIDLQLLVIAFVVIYLMKRKPKIGVTLCISY